MSLGKLVLDLSLNGTQFTVSLKQAEGLLGQFIMGANRASSAVNRTEASTRSWGKSLRDVIVSLALVRDALRTLQQVTFGWQTAIIQANSEMERSMMLMKNFSKETDGLKATQEAVKDVNMLLNRAATSPFNVSQITDAFVKLRVGGVEPAARSLNTLVDSVAAFGGSGENLKRAGVAIQQMAGKGVVSMEELRQQLGESVPTAIQAMADGLGTTYQKLVKEISQGKVLSQPAIIAMMQQLELQFKGSAAAMMNTWGGAVAQFETTTKRLAMALGGLEADGYTQDGYFKTLTTELKELNALLGSPEMLNAARELGKAMANIVKIAADGVVWIIQNRQAIFEWGKVALITFAAFKGFSVVSGILGGVSGAIGRLSTAMIALNAAGTPLSRGFTTWVGSVTGWSNATAIAAANATRLATGLPILAGAVRVLGGAIGMLMGPLGLVITLLGGMAYAMMQNKRAADDNVKSIRALNGALTDNAQLATLLESREQKRKDYKDKYETANFSGYASKAEKAKIEQQRLADAADLKKLDDEILKGRLNVAKVNANTLAERTSQLNQEAVAEISRRYKIDAGEVLKQFQEEAKKTGKAFDEKGYRNTLIQIGTLRMQDEIDQLNKTKDEAQRVLDELDPDKDGKFKTSGKTFAGDQEQLEKWIAAKKVVNDMTEGVAELRVQMHELGKTSLEDTLIAGKADDKGKPQFDALKIFVDGMRKKLATLDAKLEETNPYLAQMEATIESLGGKKLPNFDKMVAEGQRIAAELWQQEKARKAITDAAKLQKDAIERIDQIQTLANAKLNKAEERNPWEKASADAIRYEEELDDLIAKMNEAREKAAQAAGTAGPGLLKQLEEDAKKATSEVEETRKALERLKVADAGKRMNEDAIGIRDGLMTDTERAKSEFDRQNAYLDEFFAKHQEYLTKDADAEAAYYSYRLALQEQYQRDTESGLDEWIRVNQDATDAYKSLWGSAMDKFNDTLVQGLITGKAEIGDFVLYVLEEMLRIQMAKNMANLAGMIGGSDGGGGLFGSIISGIGNYFTGGGGNSAAAKSTSLGASAEGYSSKYFANGGIMTEYGELALRKYAQGGIAREPQVAIYGEGSDAEAYVPLPDGRSIPVTMSMPKGAGQSAAGGNMNVELNLFNQSGEPMEVQSQESRFDGERYILDVVMGAVSRPGAFRDAIKGA